MGCGPCTEDLLQLEATQEKNVKKSDDILLSAVALNANHCTDSKRCILLTVPVLIKKKNLTDITDLLSDGTRLPTAPEAEDSTQALQCVLCSGPRW